MFSAKNASLDLGGAAADFVRFGSGKRTLIMLPGLGDGLRSVKGTALPMSVMYRCFAKTHTVYMFSRRRPMPDGFTTRDMAVDVAEAMRLLKIDSADVVGVSMGGMIAQHLAASHPSRVNRLVLVVTAAQKNALMEESIAQWAEMARRGDHTALMDSNVRAIYSEGYYRKNRWLIPLMGKMTKPKSYENFLVQAKACLAHDAMDCLSEIRAATLVVGGEDDRVLGADASREIAARIPGAELKQLAGQGHGLYEEAPDFNAMVHEFLLKEE